MLSSLSGRVRPLTEHQLEHIHGGGGEVAVSIRQPPFQPIQANLDLTYQGQKGSVTAKVGLDGQRWEGGLSGVFNPVGKVRVEGSFTTDGHGWGVAVTARIPFNWS